MLHELQLTFEDIEFDVKSGCKDYLTVKNGPNTDSPTIDMFCGILVESKPIVSETSHVLLEFHSDESNSARGFKIKVEAVNSGKFSFCFFFSLDRKAGGLAGSYPRRIPIRKKQPTFGLT